MTISVTAVNKSSKRGKIRKTSKKMALSKNKDQEKEHEQNCSRSPSEEKKEKRKEYDKMVLEMFPNKRKK